MSRILKKPTFCTHYMDLGSLHIALNTNYFHKKHVCFVSLDGCVNYPWGQIKTMSIRTITKGFNCKREWGDGYIDYMIPGPAADMDNVYKEFCKKFDAGEFA